MAHDSRVALEHFLNLNLAAPDEGELVSDWSRCPHPKIGLVGDEGSGDEAPATDECAVDETGMDFAKFVAVIHHGGLALGQDIAKSFVDVGRDGKG